MSLHDGVVVLDENKVPVIIGFEENGLRMSSGGAEIGEWSDGEYAIDDLGDGVYTITAENESLEFVPTNPSLFAAELGLDPTPSSREADAPTAPSGTGATNARSFDDSDTPAPKPATMAAFYAIAAGTALLGLWALFSLIV